MNNYESLHKKLLKMYKGKVSKEEVDALVVVTIAAKQYDISKELMDFVDNKIDTTKAPEDQIQDIVLYLETLIPPLEIVDDDFEDDEFDD